ncbi:amino acid deaminase/aldolase [Corynebacterium phoceense]
MAVDQRVRAGTSVAPLGAVDVDAFESNARAMVARAGGLPIRVASKSLCSVEALRYTLSFDGFQGILAFSIPEVIALVGEGFTDIVVAYPSVNRPALAQRAADEKLRATITVMVDETAHLDLLDSLGVGPVRVAIDLDCTLRLPTEKLGALVLGPRRSPLRTPEQVAAFARDIVGRPNLKLVGMMAYEGQVASVAGGETGPVGAVKRWIRTRSLNDLAPRRAACIAAAREVADLEFVNGGTGSLHESAAEGTLTELAAGSGLYTPAIFDRFTALEHRAAAFFVCQVSRIPAPGWATVNSGGWIASGPPAADRVPVPVLPVGLKYSATEGAGEVQTPLHGRAVKNVNVGDLVWFRHAKAGEMTENVDSLLAVRHDGTVEEWSTYRGKGWICR